VNVIYIESHTANNVLNESALNASTLSQNMQSFSSNYKEEQISDLEVTNLDISHISSQQKEDLGFSNFKEEGRIEVQQQKDRENESQVLTINSLQTSPEIKPQSRNAIKSIKLLKERIKIDEKKAEEVEKKLWLAQIKKFKDRLSRNSTKADLALENNHNLG